MYIFLMFCWHSSITVKTVSPSRKEFYRSDVELLSVGDVLSISELYGSPHRPGQTLIQTGRAARPHQLQACADHVTHNCKRKKNQVAPTLIFD